MKRDRIGQASGLMLAVLLAGCANLSQVPDVDLAKAPETLAYPQTQNPAPAPVTGSLFTPASYRPAFEDHRARMVGDTLTVQITERLSASQQSTTEVDRQSSLDAGISAFPLFNNNSFARASANAQSSNSFSGEGSTQATNTFSGNITAVVTEVLPNGHLVVIGEKQIGVNQNVDVLRFSGTVDPRTIRPGNTVQSTQIANVRVLSRGRGAQNDAQTFGWLSRFFLTFFPF